MAGVGWEDQGLLGPPGQAFCSHVALPPAHKADWGGGGSRHSLGSGGPPGGHSTWKLPHVEGGGVGFRKVQASEGQPPHSTPAKAWEGASAWKC